MSIVCMCLRSCFAGFVGIVSWTDPMALASVSSWSLDAFVGAECALLRLVDRVPGAQTRDVLVQCHGRYPVELACIFVAFVDERLPWLRVLFEWPAEDAFRVRLGDSLVADLGEVALDALDVDDWQQLAKSFHSACAQRWRPGLFVQIQ